MTSRSAAESLVDRLVGPIPQTVQRGAAGTQHIADLQAVELRVPAKLRRNKPQTRVKDVLERASALEEGRHLQHRPKSGSRRSPGGGHVGGGAPPLSSWCG